MDDASIKRILFLRVLSRVAPWLLMTIGLAFSGGCATTPTYQTPPITVAEIVSMSQAGVPAQAIIQRIRASGTVYRLQASQLAQLRKEGVPDAVVDYMQRTYLRAVRRNQARRDWSNWTLGGDGYWYGGLPFGWDSDFGEEQEEGEGEQGAEHGEDERGDDRN
jgi:hypothetical protein